MSDVNYLEISILCEEIDREGVRSVTKKKRGGRKKKIYKKKSEKLTCIE
jgi:hypothetical protein